ncbi:MAG: 16S rRNA (adenine(1518)-N(6)/adenine(1519)-N(6))-dimethyltransferase [Candidatus Aenigmarchaeota archaeon]|nr:16S rRNA (adenine(1518)-N(6)/adenine(1519)-N(6))-dimethyltransferase [Candidatus Aenigmarchaeota archaeon]
MARSAFFQDPDLDQVFLRDEAVLEKIVGFAGLKKTDTVLEIGAGPGNLTEKLSSKCGKLISIEIDERLKPVLEEKFRGKNVRFIWGNAIAVLSKEKLRYDKLVANSPYAICEPLMHTLFTQKFSSAVLTLPWRFVERLAANPEEGYYSKLSLFSQSFFRIETLLRIEKDAWHPRPDTASMVVKLTPKKPEGSDVLVREIVLQDDKKLRNALREALMNTGAKTKRSAREELEKLGIREKILDRKVSEIPFDDLQDVIRRFDNAG